MNRIPVDQGAIALTYIATVARVDRDSGEIRTDRDGAQLYAVQCLVQTAHEKPSTIEIVVPGEPKGIPPLSPVQFENLTVAPWLIDGRAGLAYRATMVRPASAPQSKPAASGAAKPEPVPAG